MVVFYFFQRKKDEFLINFHYIIHSKFFYTVIIIYLVCLFYLYLLLIYYIYICLILYNPHSKSTEIKPFVNKFYISATICFY